MPGEILLALALVVVAFLSLIFFYSLKRPKRLNVILQALGLKRRRFLLSNRFVEVLKGEKIFFEIMGESLSISLPFKSPLGFTVKKKEYLKGFEDLFGIVKTGDAELDSRLVLISNDQKAAEGLFQNESMREILKKICNEWVNLLELDGKNLRLLVSLKGEGDPTQLKDHLSNLLGLKKLLMDESYLSPSVSRVNRIGLYLLYGLPISLGILGILATAWMNHLAKSDFSPLEYKNVILVTFWIFLPIIPVYLYISYRITKKEPSGYTKFSISLCILAAWFVFSFLPIQALNGFFDKSEGKAEDFLVIDKYLRVKSRSYVFTLLKKGEKPKENFILKQLVKYFPNADPFAFRLRVKQDEYFKAEPNETIARLVLRDGALGIKWIESYTLYSREPKNDDCHVVGYRLYKEGDLNGAIREYTACLEEKGKDPLLYYNRGVAYRKKGEYENAINDFEKAIDLKPDMFEAYKNIDYILSQKKEWSRIVAYWDRYVKEKPYDPEGYFERAGAYYHWGKEREAIDDATKACKLGKKEACSWLKKRL